MSMSMYTGVREATADPGAPRFRDLLTAEWIKFWSLRSSALVLASGALTTLGICVNAARVNADRLADQPDLPPVPPGGKPDLPQMVFDPLITAYVAPAWALLMVVVAALGASVVFGEYTSGLIRTTFAAVPARRAVVAAKVTVVGAVTLVLGAAVSGGSFGVTQAILRDHDGMSLADPGALRAVVASALLLPLCAVIGMAVGALIRHAAGAVVSVIALLILVPQFFAGEQYRWVAETGNAMPLNAFYRLIVNPGRDYDLGRYPVTVAEAWWVYGVWWVVAVGVVVEVVRRRDV
ncbi:ABC transporter permease subunit [Streptomyces geranii]|uniref:ABC transporter permease subunit n=1 Tax=Streptomyces geranii TaxID=2058923 RepID=UPI001E451978|nr:ABC transporter permease subunit [Streptomyces geranii]